MRIINYTTGSNFVNGAFETKIEAPIQSLIFVFVWAVGTGPSRGLLASMIGNIIINMDFTNRNGNQTRIYNNDLLATMAEFKQQGEGAVHVNVGSDNKVVEMRFQIPISPDGAVLMANHEYIELELESLPTTDDFSMLIHGLESPLRDSKVFQSHNSSVSAGNTNRKLDISDHRYIILPKIGLKELKLVYTNGNSPEYTSMELEAIANDSNDLVVADGGYSGFSIAGSSDNYILNVEHVEKIELDTFGAAYNFKLISYKHVVSPSSALEANLDINSTVEEREDIDALQAEDDASK